MILDIAQIALPEIGQKIQRKFSSAKVSIWLCGELALNVTLQPHGQVVSQA
jgi:hypothetical protein